MPSTPTLLFCAAAGLLTATLSAFAASADDFADRPSLLGHETNEAEIAPASAALPAYGSGELPYSEPYYGNGDGYAAAHADLSPWCADCPHHGLYAFFSYDAFRGHPDGSWMNNGLVTGLNFGTRLGRFSDWTGIGFQLGSSVGVFDWSGTDYRFQNQDQAEMQGFVTYGFFHRASDETPWTYALVQDWMLNSTFSVMGENPTLAQWRGCVGYVLSPYSEVGLWGAWRGQGDTRNVGPFGSVTWRPVQHLNAYYKYRWPTSGADTSIWFGVPEHDRLTGNGSLGDYNVGALTTVPLSDRIQLFALVTYMHPSSRPGPAGALEEAWNFTIGVAWYFGRTAKSPTVAGQCWMPLMPVANNGYFLVDASRTY